MENLKRIDSFSGEYRFLSNFWPTYVQLEDDLEYYRTVEHAYQAAKSNDRSYRRKIQKMETPGEAKKEGAKIETRSDWNDIKIPIMTELIHQKFWFKEPLLTLKLLQTDPLELIEGNTWDDEFWGQVKKDGAWIGQNNLGKILMSERMYLYNTKMAMKILKERGDLKKPNPEKLFGISKWELYVRKLCFEL